MSERKIRSKEERISEIDKKIEYHKKCIEVLEKKKATALNPKTRAKIDKAASAIIAKAKENGLTNEEIAEKLGITLE